MKLMLFWNGMKVGAILALLVVGLVANIGCVGTGNLFQPAATYAIPLRALGYDVDGNLVIHSSRNASLNYNETAADGSTKVLTFSGDASGVIGAQAAAVQAIENRRFQFLGERIEHLTGVVERLAGLYMESRPAPGPREPGARDELLAILRQLLSERAAGDGG